MDHRRSLDSVAMRIVHVWDGEYPWDVRVEKVSRALTDAGHDVHLVARNRGRLAPVERLPEATVHRLAPWRVLGRRLDAASQFPAPVNPRWFRLIARVARTERADALLVRDLPLAVPAVVVARALGLPIVLDMAENYPAMIRDLWTTGSARPGDRLVRNPRAVEAVERWTVTRVDHILAVVEESRDRLVAALGVAPERITLVGNTPARARVDAAAPPRARRADAPLSVVYLGLLEHARGIGSAIDAVARCRADGIPVRLTLIGDGRARETFVARIAALGLAPDAVRLLGHLPYADALRHVAEAHVGLIPHLPNESWQTTIPNKLFDYMAAGLCVVSSDARPAARVVREAGAGRVYPGGDAEALARTLTAIWRDADTDVCGARGQRAIREQHHWERDAARLAGVFANLASPALRSATARVT